MRLHRNQFSWLCVALGLPCLWTLGCASEAEPLAAVELGVGAGGIAVFTVKIDDADDSTIYKHQPTRTTVPKARATSMLVPRSELA
jgi:hypothetical protein